MLRTWKNVIVTALAVVLILSFASFTAASDTPPVTAFKKLGVAVENQDWGAFWDGCETSTRQTLSQLFLFALALGSLDNPELQKKLEQDFGNLEEKSSTEIDKDTFIKIMGYMVELGEGDKDMESFFKAAEIVEKERKDDKAYLVVKAEGKKTEEIIMMFQNDDWKYYIANPFEGQGAKTEAPADIQPEAQPEEGTADSQPEDSAAAAKEVIKKFFK